MWFGLHIGLSYDETMTVPMSLLLDLVSIEQIKEEGFEYEKPEKPGPSDADEWDRLLSLK